MWRDLKEDEIKYLNKVVIELKNKIKFHRAVMLLSYLAILLILIITNSLKFKYIIDILQIIFINPVMWVYIYIYVKVNHLIRCLSEKGYTKCLDIKILDMFPEDSSKNANWYANIKEPENEEIMEKIMCYNGSKINKVLTKKGIYGQAIIIDLISPRKRKKFEKENIERKDKTDYLIYDLTNL